MQGAAMTTQVRVQAEVLHITSKEPGRSLCVADMAEQMSNLHSFIVCASVIEHLTNPTVPGLDGLDPAARVRIHNASTRRTALEEGRVDAQGVLIRRLSYQSPWDIVLYAIGGSGGTATLYAVLRLYNKLLDTVKHQSDTALHVTKNEVIRQHLLDMSAVPDRHALKKVLKAKDVDKQLLILIDRAATAAVQIDSVRIEKA